MRLDKYLKLSRLVKRRTVAQEMIEVGAVRTNKKTGKPSTVIKDNDTIEIAYPRRVVTLRVITSDETQLKRGAAAYELVEERHVDQEERPW